MTETNNITKVICAWCGGSGNWNIAPGSKAACVVCGGLGNVSVNGRPRACWECRGKGRINDFSPCLTCAGTGWELVLER